MLNSRPDPVVSRRDAGALERGLRQPVRLLDLLEHESELIDRELDGDLRPGIVARHDALELVPAFAAEREHEQLLRDRSPRRPARCPPRAARRSAPC